MFETLIIVGLVVWGIVAAIKAAVRVGRRITANAPSQRAAPPTVLPVNPEAWSAFNALLGRMSAAAGEEFARPLPAELTALAASPPLSALASLVGKPREYWVKWLLEDGPWAPVDDPLLSVAEQPTSWWRRHSGWGHDGIGRIAHALRLLQQGARAEHEGSLICANFFWDELHRRSTALWSDRAAWGALAGTFGRNADDLRDSFFDLLSAAHAGFYNGRVRLGDATARRHMAALEALVRLREQAGDQARRLLAPPAEAAFEHAISLKQWGRALRAGRDLIAKYREHRGYRERLIAASAMLVAHFHGKGVALAQTPPELALVATLLTDPSDATSTLPTACTVAIAARRTMAVSELGRGHIGDAIGAARAAEQREPNAVSRALVERLEALRDAAREEFSRLEAQFPLVELERVDNFATIRSQVVSEPASATPTAAMVDATREALAAAVEEPAAWMPILPTETRRHRATPLSYWIFSRDALGTRVAGAFAVVAMIVVIGVGGYNLWARGQRETAYDLAVAAAAKDDDQGVLTAAEKFFAAHPLGGTDDRVAHVEALAAAAQDAPQRRLRDRAILWMAEAARHNNVVAAMAAAADYANALPTVAGVDDPRRGDVADFYAREFTTWFATLHSPLTTEATAAVSTHKGLINALDPAGGVR